MTWHEAMERFGSDKPDIRFGMELVDLTDVFAATEFNAFQAAAVKGIRVAGRGATTSRSRLDDLTDQAKRWGAKGLVWMRVEAATTARSTLDSPVAKFLSDAEQAGIVDALGAEPGDLVLHRRRRAAPRSATCSACCGSSSAGRRSTRAGCSFLWVVDFPLFEALDERRPPDPGAPPVHDAAPRRPRPARRRRPTDLLAVRSQAYDLVLNGWELGSGSVRIHRSDIQQRIFSLLGIAPEEAQAQVRLPARRVPLRRAAARRLRVRHRPARRAARGRGEHPRGDRLPEDPVGRRPADRGADRDRRRQLAELGLRLLPPST